MHAASVESSDSRKRRLSVRQQPRSQRWYNFRPVGRDPSLKPEKLNDSTSFSYMSHRGGKQYASSWVDLADELAAKNDNAVSRSTDVERVAPTCWDANGGVEGLETGVSETVRERSATHEFHSSLAGVDSVEREEMGNVRNKMHRVKVYTIRSLNAAIPRFKRRYPGVNKPIVKENTAAPNDLPHLQTKSDEIERLRRDLSESQSRVAELQKRLEVQSRDLENSNSFLNTVDKSSDADVIHALQRLNAEVQQNTTYMADCLVEDFEFEHPTNSTKEQTAAAQRVSRRISIDLVKSFETNSPEDVPMLLQIAFQAYFASVLCQAASSWAFEPGHNMFIRELYQKLRRVGEGVSVKLHPAIWLMSNVTEAQAIAGRWRSLTRAHNVNNWIGHTESLVKGIVTDISDVMLAAGCIAPRSDIMTKVISKFEEKICSLVELAGGLSKMFDEVISSDFEVFIVRPGEEFKAVMMEDTDDGPAGVEGAPILCSTHIGLTKRVPVGTLWEKGKKQKIMVLRAKVLLHSFLDTGA